MEGEVEGEDRGGMLERPVEGGREGWREEAGAHPQQTSRGASCREKLSRRASKVAVATVD